jgi:hypothetical protein
MLASLWRLYVCISGWQAIPSHTLMVDILNSRFFQVSRTLSPSFWIILLSTLYPWGLPSHIVRQNLLWFAFSDLAKIWMKILLVGLGIELHFNFELGRHEPWGQLNLPSTAGNIKRFIQSGTTWGYISKSCSVLCAVGTLRSVEVDLVNHAECKSSSPEGRESFLNSTEKPEVSLPQFRLNQAMKISPMKIFFHRCLFERERVMSSVHIHHMPSNEKVCIPCEVKSLRRHWWDT